MNSIAKVENTQLSNQTTLMSKISLLYANRNVPLTDYQIKCGGNAVAKMFQMAQQNNRDLMSYPQSQTLFVLQNIIGNNWDVLQGEGVIIFQNNVKLVEVTDKYKKPLVKDGKVVMKKEYEKYLDLRPTAKGHLKSVRKFAAGTNKTNPVVLSYVVYEDDEFTDISYVGVEIKPPTYSPKYLSNKVLRVVYALNMIDGTVQYIVGHREQVKPALIAQAKNNGAPDNDLEHMNKLKTVDEILTAYEGKTFQKIAYGKKEEKAYFNDTWLAGYNREQMLETKLRGVIANRMIEKEYDNELSKEAFEYVVAEKQSRKDNAIDHESQSEEFIEESNGTRKFDTDKRSNQELNIIEEEQDEHEYVNVDENGEVIEEEIVEEEEVVAEVEPPKKQEEPKKEETKPKGNGDLFGGAFGL